MRVVFHTSGTTGKPKPIEADWDAMVDSAAGRIQLEPPCVLCCYHPATMAGLQVFAYCVKHDATLVLPPAGAGPDAMVQAGLDSEVTHICCTPSQIRRMLMGGADRIETIRQVTLGGEHTTQATIDCVVEAWPDARITHIYATSELGVIASVSDDCEGIPIEVLFDVWPGSYIDADGELVLWRDNIDAHYRTGDLFDIMNDRCIFRGRKDGVVNVAGVKVSPEAVERAIRERPGVAEVSVRAEHNWLVGHILVAYIVPDDNLDRDALNEWGRTNLPRPAVPVLRWVSQLPLTSAGKAPR